MNTTALLDSNNVNSKEKKSNTPTTQFGPKTHRRNGTFLARVKNMVSPLKHEENRKEKLVKAIEDGNIEEVRRLLDIGADINYISKKGYNLLELAARGNTPEIVRELIARGAKINKLSKLYCTIADMGDYDNLEIIKYILDNEPINMDNYNFVDSTRKSYYNGSYPYCSSLVFVVQTLIFKRASNILGELIKRGFKIGIFNWRKHQYYMVPIYSYNPSFPSINLSNIERRNNYRERVDKVNQLLLDNGLTEFIPDYVTSKTLEAAERNKGKSVFHHISGQDGEYIYGFKGGKPARSTRKRRQTRRRKN